MYVVVSFLTYPGCDRPELDKKFQCKTMEEAIEKANMIIDAFMDDYGEDYYEYATPSKLSLVASNGDVDDFVYIISL